MIRRSFGWVTAVLTSVMTTACSVGHSYDHDAMQSIPATQVAATHQSEADMDGKRTPVTSASVLGGVLKSGMAYADFREVVLRHGWEPVMDAQCQKNVVGANHRALCSDRADIAACQLCGQVPELGACSGDGYCLMKFRHAENGGVLEAVSYGMIEDWNVSGEDSRLQLSRWDVSTLSES